MDINWNCVFEYIHKKSVRRIIWKAIIQREINHSPRVAPDVNLCVKHNVRTEPCRHPLIRFLSLNWHKLPTNSRQWSTRKNGPKGTHVKLKVSGFTRHCPNFAKEADFFNVQWTIYLFTDSGYTAMQITKVIEPGGKSLKNNVLGASKRQPQFR